MKSKSADKIKMPSIDELLGVSGEESATDIEISRIHSFANHPFKVLDDDKMDDLVKSIKQNGVLTPVLVRPDKNNSYEMISGHRRMHAAIKAGLETIPAIVRDMDDDDAVVVMVDANIQREELLPSEKAFAYKTKETIAKDLLSIKAVFLKPQDPFTWASGIKSPIYCDNRLTLSFPKVRSDVENGLAEAVKKYYPDADVLMGTSTAGIAHAAITATILDMPMGYVRSGHKDHGRQNQIEGKLEKGQKVVVIEDLISTGGSVLEVVDVLREAGAEVLGIISIFTYGLQKGIDRLAAANVENHSLSDFGTLVKVAAEEGYIKPEEVDKLHAFISNPSDSAWMKL
mgnify:CR=1 FL=1